MVLYLHDGRKRRDDKFLSVYMMPQDDRSLYRHCCENLKYHSKIKKATSMSSSAHKMLSSPNIFRIFNIKITANKQ